MTTGKTRKYDEAKFADLEGDILLMGGDETERLRYAPAVLGTSITPLGEVVVYDADAVVQIIEEGFSAECQDEQEVCEAEHDHWSEAQEHFDFNVVGGWVGSQTPIYLPAWCAEHDESSADCPCTIAELDHWGATRDLQSLERSGRKASPDGTPESPSQAGMAAAGLPVAGSDPRASGYLDPYQFPISRLDFASAQATILQAGADPQRYWGIVAIPTNVDSFVFLQVYGQSNWGVVRPLLGWWGDPSIGDASRLATYLTRPAVRPERAYRATRTPLFLDASTPEGRRGIELLVRAAQAGEGSVEMTELLGSGAERGKQSA